MIVKKNILGVGITNASRKEILEYIVENLENFKKKLFITTPNPEFLVLASKNKDFKTILNRADLALADGVGIIMAAKVLGKQLEGRFTGVDLVKKLCEMVAEKPITVGFLGGRGGVAEKTAECLQKKHPGLKISFIGEEWSSNLIRPQRDILGVDKNKKDIDHHQYLSDDGFKSIHLSNDTLGVAGLKYNCKKDFSSAAFAENNSKEKTKDTFRKELHPFENDKLKNKQENNKTVDVLFVAFGCPKQEFWISENLEKIPVRAAIGVGGAFDYISGRVTRAPKVIRGIGLEWLFRLMVQPWRIKRQLALLEFILLVLRERVR